MMLDGGLRRFIYHSNVDNILTTLAEVITAESTIMLYGQGDPATGKSRLLQYVAEEYWRTAPHALVEGPPILYVDHTSLDWMTGLLKASAAPIVAQVLAAMMTELSTLAERYRPDRTPVRWQRTPRAIKTPSQTVWLANEVYRELKGLRVRAVLMDNAHLLDAPTLQMLQWMRQRLDHNGHALAMILAARLAKHEHPDEPMDHLFARAKIDPRDFAVPIELHALTQDEFFDVVLDAFFDDVDVVFEPQLEAHETFIAETFWERTQGDWKSIDQQARKLNRLLGRRTGTPRLVTRAIMEQVLGTQLPH